MSTKVSTRLLEKRRLTRAQKEARRRTVVLMVIATVAALCGVWWIATGPILRVHNVAIDGYSAADQAEVVQAIQIAAASGDALHLPVQAIRKAVQPMPWVEGVTVSHDWPRGVHVKVVQATPAVVAVAGSERWLVSTKGRVLGPDDRRSRRLPQMRTATLTVGGWLTADDRSVVKLVIALSPDVRGRIGDLQVTVDGLMVGRLVDSGTELRLGPPDQLWRKGRALDAVLARPETRELAGRAEYIDFSTPDAPVFGGIADETESSTSS